MSLILESTLQSPFRLRATLFLFATLISVSALLQQSELTRAAAVTVNCSGTSGAPTAVDEASLAADDVTFSDTGGDGYCEIDASISAASVIVESGVVLTHPAEDSDGITITTTGAFNINSGGTLNVDGKGCAGIANGAGRSPNDSNVCGNNGGGGNGAGGNNIGSGGGSHGGKGGDGEHYTSGNINDPGASPALFGSAGGGTFGGGLGGNAGGLVILNVGGTFTNAGLISADGSAGNTVAVNNATGGGSGGTIQITADTISLTSGEKFSAAGGAGATNGGNDSGGGGGGRISLVWDSNVLTLPNNTMFDVAGGAAGGAGSAAGNQGTVYERGTNGGTGTTTDDTVTIMYGHIFDDVDHNVGTWTIDASTNAIFRCDLDMATTATPSVTAAAITFNGSMDCAPTGDYIDSFTWSATGGVSLSASTSMSVKGDLNLTSTTGSITINNSASVDTDVTSELTTPRLHGDLTLTPAAAGSVTLGDSVTLNSSRDLDFGTNANVDIGTGVTIGMTRRDFDMDLNIPAGDSITLANFTFNGNGEGEWNDSSAHDMTLSGTTAINGNVNWSALTNLTLNNGTSINADGKGCQLSSLTVGTGAGPNASNVCVTGGGGAGLGAAGNNRGSGGGGHGGGGGNGTTNDGGPTFGSATSPALFGSTGGSAFQTLGGTGGGLVRLTVTGTLTHNGGISADGGTGVINTIDRASGAGSGGGISITTGTLTGTTGTLSAEGGAGVTSGAQDSGGGGGGRISLVFDTNTNYPISAAAFDVDAGAPGGGGATTGTHGTVYVRDNVGGGVATDDIVNLYYGFTFDDTDFTVGNWNTNGATNQYCSLDMAIGDSPSVTSTNSISFDGNLDCNPTGNYFTSLSWTAPSFTVASSATMSTESDLSITATTGNVVFDTGSTVDTDITNELTAARARGDITVTVPSSSDIDVNDNATINSSRDINFSVNNDVDLGTGVTLGITRRDFDMDLNISAGDDQTWNNLTVNSVGEGEWTIDNLHDITLAGTTSIGISTNWSNINDLTINAGTSIAANSEGCQLSSLTVGTGAGDNGSNVCVTGGGGAGAGLAGNNRGAGGGGHGGAGGAGTTDAGGSTFDSLTLPNLFGATGGSAFQTLGGVGGGLIRLTVFGNMIHNGLIAADGGDGLVNITDRATGGGSGGTIRLHVNDYNCSTGTFSVDGGAGVNSGVQDSGGGGGGRVSIIYNTESSVGCPTGGLVAATVAPGGAAGGGGAVAGSTGTVNIGLATCGDGTTEGIEQCDDSNVVGGDGCDSMCRTEACGNGFVQTDAGEACDDGNTTNGDGCSNACVVEPGYSCTGEPSECDMGGGGGPPVVCPAITEELSDLIDHATLFNEDGTVTVRLEWALSSAQPDYRFELHRGIGGNIKIDNMSHIGTLPFNARSYNDTLEEDFLYGKTIRYSLKLFNRCNDTIQAIYTKGVTLPGIVPKGTTFDLVVEPRVKIKGVRDDFLLRRIKQVLMEQHASLLPDLVGMKPMFAQLVNQTSEVLQRSGFSNFIRLQSMVRNSIAQAFFPQGKDAANQLELEFFDKNEQFLFIRTVDYLQRNNHFDPTDLNPDWSAIQAEIDPFVQNEVTQILEEAKKAETVITDLANQLGKQTFSGIDPNSLTSLAKIEANSNLRKAILDIPNIEDLIKGHSDTLTFEVWNPGDRTTPLYQETLETDLFGWGRLVLENFTPGDYDFTVNRNHALRKSLNEVNVRFRSMELDFTKGLDEDLKFGDVDNSGNINLDDIRALGTEFKEDPDRFDFDEDGSFNLMDVLEILQNWGEQE